MTTFLFRLGIILLVFPLLLSCGGGSSGSSNDEPPAQPSPPPPPPPPNAVSLAADPVEVGRGAPSLITASLGDDVEGARNDRPVNFEIKINASGGVIESADQKTDEQGRARAIYRAGGGGGTDVLRAIIPPYGDATVNIKVFHVDPVRQSLTITAEPNKVDMDGVSKITATLTDKDGPVPGVAGNFSFVSNQSGARLAVIDRSTGPDGKISANYRAGNRPGVDIVQASFVPSISATVSITVDNPTATITVSPKTLPDAEQFVPYSTLLTATGGRPNYRFSVAPGTTMPPGVSISPNGVVTGNANAMIPGSYSFVVQVRDSAGRVKLETISLTVNAPGTGLTITTSQIGEATVGVMYNAQVEASGGRTPYSWSFVPRSAVPGWIRINPGTGILSGTPVAPPRSMTLMIQVRDANGVSTTKGLTLTVVMPTSTLRIDSESLSQASIGQAYNDRLVASGGRAPYRWSVASGSSLPPWLNLSANGVVSGRQVTGPAGEISFIVQVQDAEGATASARITINVVGASPLEIESDSLAQANIGQTYNELLVASGGRAPYRWSVATGSFLPQWLDLSDNGVISSQEVLGPAGEISFIVQVQDAEGATATARITMDVQ